MQYNALCRQSIHNSFAICAIGISNVNMKESGLHVDKCVGGTPSPKPHEVIHAVYNQAEKRKKFQAIFTKKDSVRLSP